MFHQRQTIGSFRCQCFFVLFLQIKFLAKVVSYIEEENDLFTVTCIFKPNWFLVPTNYKSKLLLILSWLAKNRLMAEIPAPKANQLFLNRRPLYAHRTSQKAIHRILWCSVDQQRKYNPPCAGIKMADTFWPLLFVITPLEVGDKIHVVQNQPWPAWAVRQRGTVTRFKIFPISSSLSTCNFLSPSLRWFPFCLFRPVFGWSTVRPGLSYVSAWRCDAISLRWDHGASCDPVSSGRE